MQFKNSQSQKLGSQQKHGYYLSQHHLKLMHLMHLTGFALKEYISNELELNPVLEIDHESINIEEENKPSEEDVDLSDDLFWKQDDDLFDRSLKEQKNVREFYDAPIINYKTIQEHLKEQISLLRISEETKEIAFFIIDELDEDGYLRRKIEEVSDDYSFQKEKYTPEKKVLQALNLIHQCEPSGIAARSVQECLLIQLRKLKVSKIRNLAIRIIENQLNELTNGNFEKIAIELKIQKNEMEDVLQLIKKLNPKPVYEANKYEQLKQHIIPDFEVQIDEKNLYVSLLNSDYIKLKVNEDYVKISNNIIKSGKKNPSDYYLQNMVSEALSLVNALKDRESTMISVMHAIVKMQPDFFRTGDLKNLKPMILQDIANMTKYDISAVSRITSNKHVQTPFGIFGLKQLFMRAVSIEEKGQRATTSVQVQEMIQKIVGDENKANPLSDTEIMLMLKNKNINVARRTIVKYREISGIPNSATRKKHQLNLN